MAAPDVQRVAGRLDAEYALSVEGGLIMGIRIVRKPDKLEYLSRQPAPRAV